MNDNCDNLQFLCSTTCLLLNLLISVLYNDIITAYPWIYCDIIYYSNYIYGTWRHSYLCYDDIILLVLNEFKTILFTPTLFRGTLRPCTLLMVSGSTSVSSILVIKLSTNCTSITQTTTLHVPENNLWNKMQYSLGDTNINESRTISDS